MTTRGFRTAVMDGDRLVRAGTTDTTAPTATLPTGDTDMWVGYGPPPTPPPPGCEEYDTYVDLTTGDVYQLNL